MVDAAPSTHSATLSPEGTSDSKVAVSVLWSPVILETCALLEAPSVTSVARWDTSVSSADPVLPEIVQLEFTITLSSLTLASSCTRKHVDRLHYSIPFFLFHFFNIDGFPYVFFTLCVLIGYFLTFRVIFVGENVVNIY